MEASHRVEPPVIGEKFTSSRKDLWRIFGGEYQRGIMRFPDIPFVNVFSDDEGPYPDYIDLETEVIEYRGQGLGTKQTLTFGNKYLEQSRLQREPVRFWHKPKGGVWQFKSWVVVADRDKVIDTDPSGLEKERILWFLLPVSIDHSGSIVEDLGHLAIVDDIDLPSDDQNQTSSFEAAYRNLSQITDKTSAQARIITQRRYPRSRRLRQIVIARSAGKCENTTCTGMPVDVGKDGTSILQVDHILALAEHGMDHPSNMVALCPNCHASKTLGQNSEKFAKELRRLVAEKEHKIFKD